MIEGFQLRQCIVDLEIEEPLIKGSFAKAFEILFPDDDRRVSVEALNSTVSVVKYPSIPSEFHSLIKVCGWNKSHLSYHKLRYNCVSLIFIDSAAMCIFLFGTSEALGLF